MFTVGAVLVWSYGYAGSFLLLNGAHTPLTDAFFRHYTNLGDSLLAGSLLVLLFWRRDPAAIVLGVLAITLSGLLSQLFKNTLFAEWDRPLKIFENGHPVHFFPSERANHNSFPSGHATTAFSFTLAAAYAMRNSRMVWQLVLAWAGLLLCYSRVYVGMHFPADVIAGGLLGAACSFAFLHFFVQPLTGWMQVRSAAWHLQAWRVMVAIAALGFIGAAVGRYMYYFT